MYVRPVVKFDYHDDIPSALNLYQFNIGQPHKDRKSTMATLNENLSLGSHLCFIVFTGPDHIYRKKVHIN